jgi:hypothetical protein
MLGATSMASACGSGTADGRFFMLDVSEKGVLYAYSGTQ